MPPLLAQILLLLQAVLKLALLGPTPPPDRYDDAYDARLFAAWRGACLVGPRDPALPPQPPPLRPKAWRVLAGDPADVEARATFLREHVVTPGELLPIEREGRPATMPERGELVGSFTHAFTRFEVDADEVRFVRSPGAELVFVNGEGFIGDPDRRGWLGVPVPLRKGENEVLAVGVRGGFELELWKPMTRIVMASWALHVTGDDPWPDAWDELFVPLFNASTQPAESIHFHYDRARPEGELPDVGEWSDGSCTVPLALGHGLSYVFDRSKGVPQGPRLLASAIAFADGDAHADRRLLPLRCDEPRPRWPAPVPMCWSSAPRRTILVVESSGDPAFDAHSLAVARFCQERVWERSGELLPLVSSAFYDSHGKYGDPRGGFVVLSSSHAIRFGLLDAVGSKLRVGPGTSTDPPSHEIRATDPAAMRLVYAVEPLFRAIGPAGETWSLP